MPNVNEELFLTYDDVILRPGRGTVLPSECSLQSRFSRNILLNIPLISAAMDTVTESATAIVMAQQGGLGVIHKNMDIASQAAEITKVKKYESGTIKNPITVGPEMSLENVVQTTKKYNIAGLPVVDEQNICIGIITERDMQFQDDLSIKVKDVMTPKGRLITSPEGVSLSEAQRLLHTHRIEKLPIVDGRGVLKGLITIKDIVKRQDFPDSNKDDQGRLLVAAAVGVGEQGRKRAEALIQAQADALVIDTAHGYSQGVISATRDLKKAFPKVDILAGNVATAEGCSALIDAGVDGIKVGMGPGSICTTRVISGVGVPQMSAIWECAEICSKADVPLVADGGIKYSGDVVKALAGGANSVMIGSLFAGTNEAPGETILYHGRRYKVYRGMGSLAAMPLGSGERYSQANTPASKLTPEGIEGQVPTRGSLGSNIYQVTGGIRAGMGYVGAANLLELQEKAHFLRITSASIREGHPHDVRITKEAPNYSLHS